MCDDRNPRVLVKPAELEGDLGGASASRGADESPLVLDLRPAEAFAAGHLPGAVHLDLWNISLIDTDPAPLRAFLWIVAALLGSRGVCDDRKVVVYDEQSGTRAARAFWFLEYFGHPAARLLDGGFGAWQRAGLPVATRAVPPTSRRDRWPRVGRTRADRLATWADVRDRLGRADCVLVDTRSIGEFTGIEVRATRGGAIPGAVHMEWASALDADGAFRGGEQLGEWYRAAGVTPEREVVVYCQGGYRSAHSYLALRLLGYPRVRNYLGSWKEWGDRLDLPVEVPRP